MLKGNSILSRYFKNEEETKKCLNDGWFSTGDICAVTADGSIRIFDRVKNLIKLSQGEYISPEKLEGLYSKSLLIAQIFVYGNSYEADLIAIIVPDRDQAMKWAKAMKMDGQSFEDVCKDERFKMVIAEDLLKISKENKLSRWEFPKNICLSAIAFSVELNTLTPTLKLKRDEAFKFHKQNIESTYKLGYLFPSK
jgi:long-chain acyl-CoA synthetase